MTATIKMALEAEARAQLLCRVMEANLADDDIPMARLLTAYEASLEPSPSRRLLFLWLAASAPLRCLPRTFYPPVPIDDNTPV